MIISNNAEIFNKWHVLYLSPLGQPPESPGLLYFINEQLRLEKDLLPIDSIFPPKNETTASIKIFVIDQTTPNLDKTQQYQNFHDFNYQVERLCDSRFEFMQYSGIPRKIILQDSFPFHEAIGFYLLANTMVQNENIKYCILDYFGGNTAPFSLRITSNDSCVTCTPFTCEKICREFISGPKSRPIDALKRSNFADLLTNVKNYLLANVKSGNNKSQPIEITFISDFVHETSAAKGIGPYISYSNVNRKFSELLNECPEIKCLNLIKLPMRNGDLHRTEETRDMLKSFVERFKNGDTSLDLIEIDNLGESSECIEWLNTYSAENLKQTKPIRVFAPFKNNSFNGIAKGYFSVAALRSNFRGLQICLEPSCFENLNIEITKPNNNSFKVQIPQKSEFVKFNTLGVDTLSLTIKDVETINTNANPVLRIIIPKGSLTESMKYESISFPVQFLPKMSRSDTLWLGYLILIALVVSSYLLLDFILRLFGDNFFIVFFIAICLALICYFILAFGLPDFSNRNLCLFIAFIIPFISWAENNFKHSSKKEGIDTASPGEKGNEVPGSQPGTEHQSSNDNSKTPKTLEKNPSKPNQLITLKSPLSEEIRNTTPTNETGLATNTNPSKPKKLFVRNPPVRNSKILIAEDTFAEDLTYFVLDIDSETSQFAVVSLTPDLNTRETFLKDVTNTQICNFEGSKPSKAKDIKQIKHGKARFEGDHWVIVEPVILKGKTPTTT